MTSEGLAVRIAECQALSIEDLNAVAAWQKRVERKYIVTIGMCTKMLGANHHRFAVLDVEGRRSHRYQTIYFDNDNFDSYRSAAYRRRRRFKIRTRTYLDTSTTMLEVKTKGSRGQTRKDRQPHDQQMRNELGVDGLGLIASVVEPEYCTQPFRPVLETQYSRSTLLDCETGVRVTIDDNLSSSDWLNAKVDLEGHVVVETKSGGVTSVADRWFWAQGVRPVRFSKFGTSLAVLHPELPSNKWHRTMRRFFSDDSQVC